MVHLKGSGKLSENNVSRVRAATTSMYRPYDPRRVLMRGCDGHTVFDGFSDIEHGKRLGDDREERGFGEVHSRAYTAPIAEAHIPWVTLSRPVFRCDVPSRIERERIRIDFGVVQHIPAEVTTIRML